MSKEICGGTQRGQPDGALEIIEHYNGVWKIFREIRLVSRGSIMSAIGRNGLDTLASSRFISDTIGSELVAIE